MRIAVRSGQVWERCYDVSSYTVVLVLNEADETYAYGSYKSYEMLVLDTNRPDWWPPATVLVAPEHWLTNNSRRLT